MTTYPLGITGVTPFAYFPPVGNVDELLGGTWTESGNALTGYSGSAGGVYVGATTRQAFTVTAGTVRFVDCEAP